MRLIGAFVVMVVLVALPFTFFSQTFEEWRLQIDVLGLRLQTSSFFYVLGAVVEFLAMFLVGRMLALGRVRDQMPVRQVSKPSPEDEVSVADEELLKDLVGAVRYQVQENGDEDDEFANAVGEAVFLLQTHIDKREYAAAMEHIAPIEMLAMKWGEACEAWEVVPSAARLRRALIRAIASKEEVKTPETPALPKHEPVSEPAVA